MSRFRADQLLSMTASWMVLAGAPSLIANEHRGIGQAGLPTDGPVVYASSGPSYCFIDPITNDLYLSVYAPDAEDLVKVQFKLTLTGSIPEPPEVIAEPDVTLGAIDVSGMPYRIEASWSPRSLEHEPILRLAFRSVVEWIGARPESVVFGRADGSEVPGLGWPTESAYYDCYHCSYQFEIEPSPILVPVGAAAEIPFEWSLVCRELHMFAIAVSDTEGWVQGSVPASILWSNTDCGHCVPTFDQGHVEVLIPKGTPAGATSTMTIVLDGRLWGTRIIEATVPTESRRSTWGSVRRRYR